MSGKKNIVFGFLYLVLTAALGPYMVREMLPVAGEAAQKKQQVVAKLQLLADSGWEDPETLERLDAEAIARRTAEAVLAINAQLNARAPLESMKGGPHAHGNLESLLNVAAGLVLLFLAVPRWVKEAISWIFIAGALLHSGMLYLVNFGVGWAGTVLGTGIGPILILVGLLAIGLAAAVGLRPEPVRD